MPLFLLAGMEKPISSSCRYNGNYVYKGNDLQILPFTHIHSCKLSESTDNRPKPQFLAPPDSVVLSDSNHNIWFDFIIPGRIFFGPRQYIAFTQPELEIIPMLIIFILKSTIRSQPWTHKLRLPSKSLRNRYYSLGRRFVTQPVQIKQLWIEDS